MKTAAKLMVGMVMVTGFLLLMVPRVNAGQMNTFVIVDVPGADHAYANGISNAGGQHGFTYDGATYTALDVPNACYTVANGINDAGAVHLIELILHSCKE